MKKININQFLFYLVMLIILSACGSSGGNEQSNQNKTTTIIPTPLQKLAIGNGTLSAYVRLDDSTVRFPMEINPDGNGTASVVLPGLSRTKHTVQITYEYTDDKGSFILARAESNANLTSGSFDLNVKLSEYSLAFDNDNDGITNTKELQNGTDPRKSDLVGGNFFILTVKTGIPVLSVSASDAGNLRAYITLDGNTNQTELSINNATEIANVTVPSLSQLKHTFTVTFEYTDNVGTIVVATFTGEADLSFSGQNLPLISINDFDKSVFDEDGDSASNFYELTVGSNLRLAEKPFVGSSVDLIAEGIKTFRFNWKDIEGATFYRLFEDVDGLSGFSKISNDLPQGEQAFSHIVPLYSRLNAKYLLQSCNQLGCTDGDVINVTGSLIGSIGYFKSDGSTVEPFGLVGYHFGTSVAINGDGTTLAVVNAVNNITIFIFSNKQWEQQATFSGSKPRPGSLTISPIVLSKDGDTLAVSISNDSNNAEGIAGPKPDGTSVNKSGAVYIFTRVNGLWSEQAFLKASNLEKDDRFGTDISMSDDGDTLVIGTPEEDSDFSGSTNGVFQENNLLPNSGAAYVFTRSLSGVWGQQAYIKADITGRGDSFGSSVSISGDGLVLAIGAIGESSSATGAGGNQLDNTISSSGAVYVFNFDQFVNSWVQDAYIKVSNVDVGDQFGWQVALNKTGNILAASSKREDSGDRTNPEDNSSNNSGAVYVFERDGVFINGVDWLQQDYLKAENIQPSSRAGNTDGGFGGAISMNEEGTILAIGDLSENSDVAGFNGDTSDKGHRSGAVYIFKRNINWDQQAHIKASNPDTNDVFGGTVSLSDDGNALAVGAFGEDGGSTGINGNKGNVSSPSGMANETEGAVYLY